MKLLVGFNSLTSKGHFGSDDIPLNIMKCCTEHVATPISNMIHLSFTAGCFPNQLKLPTFVQFLGMARKMCFIIIDQYQS